jgi:hypothetical protein
MDRRRIIGLEVGNNPDQHRGHRRFLGGGESIPCCLRPVHAFDLNHTRKAGLVTSHMGHSRHFDRGAAPSGLPRSMDMLGVGRHVSNVPTTDSRTAAKQQRSRLQRRVLKITARGKSMTSEL